MVSEEVNNESTAGNINKFLRFQLTAITATVIDFSVTFFLKEEFSLFYTWAVAGGAFAGAVTAFVINRYWVFQSLQRHPLEQAYRYLLVAGGSIILNTSGTYLFTEIFDLQYLVSKAMVALIVGFTYSYYFSNRFVFHA